MSFYKKSHIHTSANMLVDAREMLVGARKMHNGKIWFKGFQTHYLTIFLDKKSQNYKTFKNVDFLIFLEKFMKIA